MKHKMHLTLNTQTLSILDEKDSLLYEFLVSTALKGAGEQMGSEQTPRGLHQVRAKIGHGKPKNTVFIGRRPTGETYSLDLAKRYPNRDWILTRILWLSGLELGKNRLGQVDTMRRFIYIHGTPDDIPIGIPASHGCIRMRNSDLIVLFGLVEIGAEILIEE